MKDYDDLVEENKQIREQLITLSRCIKDIQDCAVQEHISLELEMLLRAVPVAYLSPPMYPF